MIFWHIIFSTASHLSVQVSKVKYLGLKNLWTWHVLKETDQRKRFSLHEVAAQPIPQVFEVFEVFEVTLDDKKG